MWAEQEGTENKNWVFGGLAQRNAHRTRCMMSIGAWDKKEKNRQQTDEARLALVSFDGVV